MSGIKKIICFLMSIGITVSFVGLLVCALIDKLYYGNERNLSDSPFWFSLTVFLGVIFAVSSIGGMVAIVIIKSIERRGIPKEERQRITISDLAGLPFGAANPDAELPKWISIPIVAILWSIVIIFVFIFLGCMIFCR